MPPVEKVRPDGPKIRKLIKARGYSVSGFGIAIGRHPQTLSDIVRGKLNISIPLLFEIARGLHVEPSAISDYAGDDDIESESDAETKVPA